MTHIQIGDIVCGPSMNPDRKVRTWKVLAVVGTTAIGQNVAARKPFRHALRVEELELVERAA